MSAVQPQNQSVKTSSPPNSSDGSKKRSRTERDLSPQHAENVTILDRTERREKERVCCTDSQSNDLLLFEQAKERVERVKRELQEAQANLDQVRKRIRSNGGCEPDSLLILCDGEDNPILSIIMAFLTMKEVALCEVVCRTMKQQAEHYWKQFDKDLMPSHRSESAQNAKQRVVRYHSASTLAKRIGGMGDSISTHLMDSFYDRYTDEMDYRRVEGCCEGGCDFPEELNFGVFHPEARDDYELFVRFSRTRDNLLFAEGFLPVNNDICTELEMTLHGLDLTSWPKLAQVSQLVVEREELDVDFDHGFNSLFECMKELTVTIVAVHKTSSEVSLVIAQCDFAGSGGPLRGGSTDLIDDMGNHGFCWPRGRMSARSHGIIEKVRKMNVFDGKMDSACKLPYVHLGMLFGIVTWKDLKEPERVLGPECVWTLVCQYDFGSDDS